MSGLRGAGTGVRLRSLSRMGGVPSGCVVVLATASHLTLDYVLNLIVVRATRHGDEARGSSSRPSVRPSRNGSSQVTSGSRTLMRSDPPISRHPRASQDESHTS
eukprot:821627-Prymnesium_polylepis.1